MPEPSDQPQDSSGRKWFAVALGCVIAWAVFAVSTRSFFQVDGMPPPNLTPFPVARPAEFSWPLLDLDDKPVEFSTFQGKTVLLNIWATWCPPCREEMPSIARLAESQAIRDAKIAIVCVSTDESAQALRDYVKDKGWPMTFLRATSVPPAFQTDGIPATFLIAPDGGIVAGEMGAARWDDPSVIDFLVKLAKKVPDQ